MKALFILTLFISSITLSYSREYKLVPYEVQDAAFFAILNADKETMLKLLNEGWDPNFDTGSFPLLNAMESERHHERVLNTVFTDFTPEMEEVAQLIFNYGADPNYLAKHDNATPLYWAIDGDRKKKGLSICRTEYVHFLLKNGADINKVENLGGWETALENLDNSCGAETTKLLLSYRPKIMEFNCGNGIAKHYSLHKEYVEAYGGDEKKTPSYWIAQYLIDNYNAPDYRKDLGEYLDWSRKCDRNGGRGFEILN